MLDVIRAYAWRINLYSTLFKISELTLILSRLRKMELIVKNQVEAMTIHYDIETDGLFLQGIEKGDEGLKCLLLFHFR